ncbi:MAG: S1-C subfamily serine protease [Pseudohongiellaceae bacterium]|jgi:S1-C subfamily serine protease
MKFFNLTLLSLAALFLPVLATAQAPDYAAFKTNDEENNIAVFKQASPSVVNVTNSRLVRSFRSLNPQEVPQGSGTGFIWSKEGYVVTNYHVVQQADRVSVTLQDGTTYDARPVGLDAGKDLAVLKIDAPAADLVPVIPGDSSLLEVGRKVIAIGNPFGLDTTMTVGVVSALGREIDSVSRRKIRDVIQTDAAINPGNSGGPLLNSLGQLVGVNTAIYSPSGGSSGIGFAIPVNTVKDVVPQLIAHGRVLTPVLGIRNIPQPDYYRQMWGIKGVIVMDVVEGTDPARLGMRGVKPNQRGRIILGDVIVEIDSQPIANEDDYASILEKKKPGDTVNVVTRRDNQSLSYQIQLQAAPDQ